jgi:hypothetical protein
MNEIIKKVVEKTDIKLNQNLWSMTVGLVALGAAEKWGLITVYWITIPLAGLTMLSVIVTTLFYTINYCKQKKATWEEI